MGLKLLTLAYCSANGKRVILHATGEIAHVIANFEVDVRKMSYSLCFGDGRILPVLWSIYNRGYVSLGGMDFSEVTEIASTSFG